MRAYALRVRACAWESAAKDMAALFVAHLGVAVAETKGLMLSLSLRSLSLRSRNSSVTMLCAKCFAPKGCTLGGVRTL